MNTKYCLATCLFLLLTHLLHAQFRLGVKGGLNLNQPIGKVKGKPDSRFQIDRYDLHPNFHAGLSADIPVSKKFHIRPDLLYSRRIAKYEEIYPASGANYSERLEANYVELPVNFVYYHKTRQLNFYIGGGPYFGYVLSGKSNSREWKMGGGWDPSYVLYNQEEDWYKKFSWGAVLSAGIDLPFGLVCEFSVHRAFNDANNSHVVNNHTRLYNFNYGLSIGYLMVNKRS